MSLIRFLFRRCDGGDVRHRPGGPVCHDQPDVRTMTDEEVGKIGERLCYGPVINSTGNTKAKEGSTSTD